VVLTVDRVEYVVLYILFIRVGVKMCPDPALATAAPTLSVAAPTCRDSANIPVLFERIRAALDGLPWEMLALIRSPKAVAASSGRQAAHG
jgi:hypothetical protein